MAIVDLRQGLIARYAHLRHMRYLDTIETRLIGSVARDMFSLQDVSYFRRQASWRDSCRIKLHGIF